MRARLLLLLFVALLGCAPGGALAPQTPAAETSARFTEALMAEATDPTAAHDYLLLLEQTLGQPGHRLSLAAALAAVDALVFREVHGMPAGIEHALAHRARELLEVVSARLRLAWTRGEGGAFERALVADALHELALRVGAEKAAATWRRRAGCVAMASVAGPTAWPPLGALEGEAPVKALEPLPARLRGVAPFAAEVSFEPVYADACWIDVDEPSALRGLRVVAVDIEVPEAQRVHVALSSSSAAKAELGGAPLVAREYAASAGQTTRFATAHVEAGIARLVVRVAQNQDGNHVRVVVLDEAGKPLRTRAPRAGDRAPARARAVRSVPAAPEPARAEEIPLVAAALLAAGETRRAAALFEHRLAPEPRSSPEAVDLLRIRALAAARALPKNQLLPHLESAAARVRERCAGCWEATLAAAEAANARQGQGGGAFAALALLGVKAGAPSWADELSAPLLIYVAVQAERAGMSDVARVAYDALAARAPGAPALADLDWALFNRSGDDLVQAACDGGTSRAAPRCMQARIARSDLRGFLKELSRLRKLRGSPALYREQEIKQWLAFGHPEEALFIYDALPPGRRHVAVLGEALGTEREKDARQRFARDVVRARDVPYAIEPLARWLGVIDDRTARLEAEGAELVARDRAEAYLPGAATAVLRRDERYTLRSDGLLSFWLYDLRRVSGTSDVAAGTHAGLPIIEGRAAYEVLRQRIHKKDGRVLDPDPSAEGAQADTQLSQLEAGDYVESITVGFALPEDHGQLVVDTPDVLPLRTSVREGRIELSRPAQLPLSVWAHPLLGKGTEAVDKGQRITVWTLANQTPRRIEEGVAPLEARVAISFGTDSYQRIAQALGDRFRSLDERDPYVGQWLNEEVLKGESLPEDKKIARVVAAVGKAVRQSDAYALSDAAAGFAGGPQSETARFILERGSGSRTWVVHRALRELGIDSQLAVAEAAPFSAAPGFPAHTGRFVHPLVRARLGGETLWIDADVDGPPLPPGRVSPELRGRQALLASGEMVTVDASSSDAVDQVDIRLRLDERGDASGTFTALLYGRPAQGLAQAFEVVVGSDRDELLRNVVLGWLPYADVRQVSLSSDEGSWQVAIRAEITLVGFAVPEDRQKKAWSLPGVTAVHSVFPRPDSTTLGARYAAHAGRTTALAIDEPLLYHVRRRIELPAGAKVIQPPSALSVSSPALSASRTVSAEGGVIEDELSLNLPVGTIEAEGFDGFVREVQRVDDGFMHSIRIEL